MKQGFVKVAAASCAVAVADVRENTRVILETIHKMEDEGAKVMVLPELALTGYTCSDLFWQSQMIDAAKEGLKEIADERDRCTDFCRPSVGTGRKAV